MYTTSNTTTEVLSRIQEFDFSQWSDEELILEYRTTQQRAAFEELVHRYERELFNYLRHYLGDADSAEDVFQTTFLQIHLKCDQFEEGRSFRPWLYRIATNQAIDLRRKTRRYHVISLDENCDSSTDSSSFVDILSGNEIDPLNGSINAEQAGQVREAIAQLPELLKQVLYLVYFQGMKYRDAAESLGIPFGTIKSRLNAAVKKLNNLLSDDV